VVGVGGVGEEVRVERPHVLSCISSAAGPESCELRDMCMITGLQVMVCAWKRCRAHDFGRLPVEQPVCGCV